jgi:streptogramin lyase
VATGAGNVWVTRGNNVLRIDPGESEVTKTIAAGRPQGLGVGAGSVWVTQLNEHLLRVDARSGKLTADRDLSSQLFVPLVQDGSVWLVAYANKTTQVLRLDPSTLVQQGAAIPFTVERFPFDLASGAGALWTVTPADGAVWRIDPKTDRAEEVVVLGHHPIALAAGDGAVWVAVQEEPL